MCFFRDPREGGRKQCVFEAFQNALCLQLELQLEGGRKQCVFEAFQNALCLQLDGGKGERKRAGLPKRTLLATGGRGGLWSRFTELHADRGSGAFRVVAKTH